MSSFAVRFAPILPFVFGCANAPPASGATQQSPAGAGVEQAPLEAYQETIPGTNITFEMIPLPGGVVEVPGRDGPRRVDVGPIWIAKTEVTWDAYDVFALGRDAPESGSDADAIARPSQPYGAPDYGWGREGYPVISVTRVAAEAFTEWLTARTDRRYRLPTEAEWLHAAQLAAGGEPVSGARLDSIAWHEGNAAGKTQPVGSKQPDALGLHDLFGNAAEWVVADDQRPVARGGSFEDAASAFPDVRAVQDPSWNERDPQLPQSRWWLTDAPFVGFRFVRDP